MPKLQPQSRAAIDRIQQDRPGLGIAFLFPSPQDQSRPVSKELASTWLQRAEKLAKLGPLDGGLWHPFRRKWVNERKHWPDKDVAASGGWSDHATVQAVYQQADEATMFQVVSSPRVLREA